jgi:hypothetical protein
VRRRRRHGGFQIDTAGGKQRDAVGGHTRLLGFPAAEGPCLIEHALHTNLPSRHALEVLPAWRGWGENRPKCSGIAKKNQRKSIL